MEMYCGSSQGIGVMARHRFCIASRVKGNMGSFEVYHLICCHRIHPYRRSFKVAYTMEMCVRMAVLLEVSPFIVNTARMPTASIAEALYRDSRHMIWFVLGVGVGI